VGERDDDRIAEFVLDTPVMRAFVAEVQAAIAAASSPQDACAAIEPRFAELLAYSWWLPDEYQAAAPESGMGGGIVQWLLYRADDGSLSFFSLVVSPGSETPIHDHLAWGLVGLYRGTRDEEIYAQRGGARVRRAAFARAGRLLRPDPAARRHPPRADHVCRDLCLDPPADERHRLRLAACVGYGVRSGKAVPLWLRQRGLRRLIPG
jgi:hypothetical protein